MSKKEETIFQIQGDICDLVKGDVVIKIRGVGLEFLTQKESQKVIKLSSEIVDILREGSMKVLNQKHKRSN